MRADLKFHSSSRMKPRWLAFALTLPTDDVLFVQYTVPTIVMSRQCDQHNKVCHWNAHLADPHVAHSGGVVCNVPCSQHMQALLSMTTAFLGEVREV